MPGSLSERDICTQFITPALNKAGWNFEKQVREEVSFTDGKIYVKGNLTKRGIRKRADYILYYKPNIPIAIIEAKDHSHTVGGGMQQALNYARILDIPCVFSSNGKGFMFHDRTNKANVETELDLNSFPTPEILWEKYKLYKGISTPQEEKVVSQDYYFDGSGRAPRYYQQIAVNRTVEAIAKGQNRILLVMATGTGKTYTAFQIIYRLWQAGAKKRVLFLADRNALLGQAKRGDFKYFRNKMTIVKNREVDKAYEVYLALYQGLTGTEEAQNIYKQFSPDFFDLIVIDECHRSSAREDSSWHDILLYFNKATHIGLTATPKETIDTSNIEYFGKPIYTYSLKQGIEDGFLAPYKVLKVGLNIDLDGWRPPKGYLDKNGNPVEDRIYNRSDFDRNIVVEERRKLVAKKISEYLKATNRYNKSIVFCVDIEHAEGMRNELVNANSDLAAANSKYIMQITGDNPEGIRELDNFTNPEEPYPVIATTSKLMNTGIDAQTCKLIVLDSNIQSMTEFKQIIGRGTRINEDYDKLYFTIMDFRNVTSLFADKDFDGDPVRVKQIKEDEDLTGIEDEDIEDTTTITDEESGEEIIFDPPINEPEPPQPPPEPREKVFVNGVDVSILLEREIYFDNEGKQITTSLKDFTKSQIKEKYKSLDDFLNVWNSSDKKTAVIEELENQGVMLEELENAVKKQLDIFDLICHTAYDVPPLTRKERANNVKKRNYFSKFSETCKKVMETLLDKYSDEGIMNLESMDILRVHPLTDYGSPIEIIKEFGGKENYLQAVKELEIQLYKSA
ncbi:MAG: DEAD/DEAH box helicase family protein [Ignavibacteria bacterium]|nr:DEAD/DEAH box helicase family protein [Ignavibacteria bacterium]